MTENGAMRMKRNGARLFKNPPQPHMCIQDFLQGTNTPCYVNVLSWDKVSMPWRPSLPLPLYGGMRLPPPRNVIDVMVFAVMVNPEVLRVNGKNADDLQKQSTLIECLLDFVESENTGLVFTRQYTILKDRDITGELKEVWNAVQARRDREQQPQQQQPQQETWIDAQPTVSQYPQYSEQQQQQDYALQPPQYHNGRYGRANDGMSYENYNHQQPPPPQQPNMLGQNDQVYQTNQMIPQQYHNNVTVCTIPQERYNYKDCNRDVVPHNVQLQTCPAYTAPQYQYQQMPRQMVPQYVESNMHSSNVGYNQMAATGWQQPYVRMEPNMHLRRGRPPQLQPQSQPPPPQPIHVNHVQQVPQYERANTFNWMNLFLVGKPQMGVAQKNNTCKRQILSPTHHKHNSCTGCRAAEEEIVNGKPQSPVKVLQREQTNAQRDSQPSEKAESNFIEEKIVQVTDLDEDATKRSEEPEQSAEAISCDVQQAAEKTETLDDSTDKQNVQEVIVHKEKQTNNNYGPPHHRGKSKHFGKNKHKDGYRFFQNDQRAVDARGQDNSAKRSQTTMNSIIKSVFKMQPNDETGRRGKSNGQTRDNEEAQGYVILKKQEPIATETVIQEMTQLCIQDCKETAGEVNAVIS